MKKQIEVEGFKGEVYVTQNIGSDKKDGANTWTVTGFISEQVVVTYPDISVNDLEKWIKKAESVLVADLQKQTKEINPQEILYKLGYE